jgi:hypothetical protein
MEYPQHSPVQGLITLVLPGDVPGILSIPHPVGAGRNGVPLSWIIARDLPAAAWTATHRDGHRLTVACAPFSGGEMQYPTLV